MAKESEADKNKSNIFSSIGALVGMVAGGPVGAALGGGLGALASGSSPQEAIQSGIGGLFSAGLGGKAGLALNALGAMSGGGGGANAFLGGGGGGGLQNQGASLVNLLSGKQGQADCSQAGYAWRFPGWPDRRASRDHASSRYRRRTRSDGSDPRWVASAERCSTSARLILIRL